MVCSRMCRAHAGRLWRAVGGWRGTAPSSCCSHARTEEGHTQAVKGRELGLFSVTSCNSLTGPGSISKQRAAESALEPDKDTESQTPHLLPRCQARRRVRSGWGLRRGAGEEQDAEARGQGTNTRLRHVQAARLAQVSELPGSFSLRT